MATIKFTDLKLDQNSINRILNCSNDSLILEGATSVSVTFALSPPPPSKNIIEILLHDVPLRWETSGFDFDISSDDHIDITYHDVIIRHYKWGDHHIDCFFEERARIDLPDEDFNTMQISNPTQWGIPARLRNF
jgi:hypothetical protein